MSVCGATLRPKRGSTLEAGAMKQKAPISDGRESRVVASAQRREDVNCVRTYTGETQFLGEIVVLNNRCLGETGFQGSHGFGPVCIKILPLLGNRQHNRPEFHFFIYFTAVFISINHNDTNSVGTLHATSLPPNSAPLVGAISCGMLRKRESPLRL